ncbi:MAG: outer membrane receptor protein involved in Fe transport [Halioglobus sp.]|jgi:outer membrane receptor protein involved in Fe transport
MANLTAMRPLAVVMALGSVSSLSVAQLEEVIVTAQKRLESAQDVPIALTAFDSEALEAKQILGFSDLRFTTPNVTASKTNFTAFNFQIRGIGRTLIAASGDAGVGIHVNEVPIVSPRLFETEYFDVQALEILRGPQGTLYGRNSTGGTVNMMTATAETDEFSGNFEGQFGDYDHKKIKGHINVPLGDRFAMRVAGLWLERDGYSENLYLGTDYDGRDQYSLRTSFTWEPGDDTMIDLMVSYFEEDSSRTRSQKTLCKNEPTGLLGCAPDALDFDFPNPNSQLSQLLAGTHVLGPFGIFEFGSNLRGTNPANLREAISEFDPSYESDETMVTLNISHSFDRHTLSVAAGYQDTSVLSEQDYQWSLAAPVELSPLLAVVAPQNYETFWSEGLLPVSATSENGTGSIGGHIKYDAVGLDAYDHSFIDQDQYSLEVRMASDYDGNINWVAGGFYMEVESTNDYYVFASAFDYLTAVTPVLTTGQDGYGWVAPQFRTEEEYALESAAVFGELYYQMTEALRLTLGLRYTEDEKTSTSRQLLLNNDADGERIFQLVGADEAIEVPFDDFTEHWQEFTGRAVLDWAFAPDSMAFLSFSRGYKGGGFNPAFDPLNFPGVSTSFEPEFVNAFEIGSKNIFLDGTLQVNGSVFFYDYKDLQVSKIVNRTSFNENTDAEIYGAELELTWAPDQNWLLNGNFAYLKAEVSDLQSVDTRNPTDGRDDLTLIKDQTLASNCVVDMSPEEFAALGQSQFNSCSGLIDAGFSVSDGYDNDLSGNALQNSPELSLSLGAQYTFYLPQNHSLSLRLDYYWQDEMYARNFNKPVDRIESWDVWNAQANLMSAEGGWYVRAYVKNINDDDHLVGQYLTGASSGLFTNVFAIEPRTYGLAIGYNFN